ncbi:MAG: histidine phosphatase family protein [Planctomycetota bacterium]|nr:histidine phosphatase family protein [Planctomycetota bacterium]
MVQIVLIRPGSTDFDLQGRIQGILDIPLCDEGRAQAKEVVKHLRDIPLAAIYSGPCEASTETAEIIGTTLKIKTKEIENLRNLDCGLWQGMLIDDVKHKQPKVYRQWQEQPENVCPPSGEMLATAAERVETVLEKLIKKHRGGAFGMVVPEPLASVVVNLLQGGELGDLWKAANGCNCCQVFTINPSTWRSDLGVAMATTKSAEPQVPS